MVSTSTPPRLIHMRPKLLVVFKHNPDLTLSECRHFLFGLANLSEKHIKTEMHQKVLLLVSNIWGHDWCLGQQVRVTTSHTCQP